MAKARMKELKITQESLAERLGVTQGAVAHWLSGRREPDLETISRVLAVLDMPGLQIGENSDGKTGADDHHGPDENGSPSKKDYALIPQYTARASAGKGYHNDHIELSEGQGLVFKRDWLKRLSLKEGTSCVIYAEGSSMEPTISDGDVLLIDRASTEPRSGKVYAIQRPDGSISVKRLVQTFAGGWVVRSDNPDKTLYPDEPISADDLQQIEIIGRSVWGGGGM